jgi:hypothetical protein
MSAGPDDPLGTSAGPTPPADATGVFGVMADAVARLTRLETDTRAAAGLVRERSPGAGGGHAAEIVARHARADGRRAVARFIGERPWLADYDRSGQWTSGPGVDAPGALHRAHVEAIAAALTEMAIVAVVRPPQPPNAIWPPGRTRKHLHRTMLT